MRRLTALILAGFALVSIVALAALRPPSPAANQESGTLFFPELATALDKAQTIEIAKGETRFSITKAMLANNSAADAVWTIPDKGGYPAALETVRKLGQAMAALRRVEPKTDDPTLLPLLQLGDPNETEGAATAVTLKDSSGNSLAAILVGKRAGAALRQPDAPPTLYVRLPGNRQSWRAEGDLAPPAAPIDFASRELADIKGEQIVAVTFHPAEGKEFTLARPKPDAPDFVLRDTPAVTNSKPGAPHSPSPDTLDSYATALQNLTLDDVARRPTPLPPATEIVNYTLHDGTMINVSLIPWNNGSWALFDVKPPPGGEMDAAATRLAAQGNFMFLLPDYKRTLIAAKLAALYPPANEKHPAGTRPANP